MRIALIIGAVLLLIVAGAGLFVATADPNDYKGWIESAASQALDKKVELRGPIELERGLTPRLVVQDLAVFEPDEPEPVIAVGRAEGSLVLPALLRGQIHVPRVAIRGVDVRLPLTLGEDDGDGAGEGVDDAGAEEPTQLPRIDTVEIAEVRISYARGDGEPIDLLIESAVIGPDDRDTRIDVAGELAGLPLAVSGTIGNIEALFAGATDLPAELAVSLGEAKLEMAGTLSLGAGGRGLGYDLDLALDAPAVDQLLAALGSEVAPLRAATASAHLAGDQRRLEVSALVITVDDTDLAGALAFELDGRPAITGEVQAERLDLRSFLMGDDEAAAATPSGQVVEETAEPSVSQEAEAAQTPSQAVEGTDMLDQALIRVDRVPLDLDLKLAIGRLDLPNQQIEDISATVVVTRQDIGLAIEAARFAGSAVGARLSVDGGEEPAQVSADAAFDALDVAAASDALGVASDLSGTLAIEASLGARGDTLRELLASLSGGVSASAQLSQPVGERTLTVALDRLAIDLAEADGATAVELEGSVDDPPVQISGRLSTLAQLLERQGELAVAIDVGLGETRLDLDGRMAVPSGDTPFDYAFELALDVPAPAKLAALAGAAVPNLPPSKASARIHRSENAALIDDLIVTVGASELAGGLALGFGGPRPELSGAIQASLVDLAELTPPDDGAVDPAVEGGAADGRVIPAVPLPLPSTIPIDLDLAITVERLHTPHHEMTGIEAKVEVGTQTVDFDLAGAEVLEGIVALGYRADEVASPPAIGVQIDVDDIDLDHLLDRSTLRGELDMIVQLDGHGADLRTFLGGADGQVEVTTGALFVPGELASLAGQHVLTAILPTFEAEPGLNIYCSLVRVAVAGGKATTTALVVDSERLTVGGGGGVDLASEAVDFLILPEGKGVELGALTAPVHVGGTLGDPRVLPDAPELLFSTTESLAFGAITPWTLVVPALVPGTSGREACIAAAEGPGKEPDTVFDKAGGAVVGTVEGVGAAAGTAGGAVKSAGESAVDTIKGLFGGSSKEQ